MPSASKARDRLRKREQQAKKHGGGGGRGRGGGGRCGGNNLVSPQPLVSPPPLPPSVASDADNPTGQNPGAVEADNPTDKKPVLTLEDGRLRIKHLSLQVEGCVLLKNTSVDLYKGGLYTLVGPNGSGKSTLLAALGRDIPIPQEMTCYHLVGIPESDITVLDAVMCGDGQEERSRLEQQITDSSFEANHEEVYNQLDNIGPKALHRACDILAVFGFTSYMRQRKTKSFNEAWRMRIGLTKPIYLKSDLLLLDDPTMHLDFEACAWLEEQLRNLENIVLIASNCTTFLTNVCSDVIEIDVHNKILVPHFTTSYNQYLQEKSQGQNEAASTNTPSGNKFSFTDIAGGTPQGTKLVQFSKVKSGRIFMNLNLDIAFGSKIALVGPNGSGKSTLLKLLACELFRSGGNVTYYPTIRIKSFDQHSTGMLDQEKSGMQYMMTCSRNTSDASLIAAASNFGLSQQVLAQRIKCLSDGQRTRLIFSALAVEKLHLLLLDEHTFHLDSDAVNCLAEGLKNWDGAFVIAGHDTRLISLVAQEMWVCETGKELTIRTTCDIMTYRKKMI